MLNSITSTKILLLPQLSPPKRKDVRQETRWNQETEFVGKIFLKGPEQWKIKEGRPIFENMQYIRANIHFTKTSDQLYNVNTWKFQSVQFLMIFFSSSCAVKACKLCKQNILPNGRVWIDFSQLLSLALFSKSTKWEGHDDVHINLWSHLNLVKAGSY